jgi:hypothetical protein
LGDSQLNPSDPQCIVYALAGLASITVSPATNVASLRIEQRGFAALSQDAIKAAGVWPAPPALALQAGTGAAYLTAERMPGGAGGPWVSVFNPLT